MIPPHPARLGPSPGPVREFLPAPPPEVLSSCPCLDDICASNLHLHAIRTAQHAPKVARLQNALSLFASSVRVAYATAFLEARAALDPNLDSDRAQVPIAAAASLRGLALEFVAALQSATPSRHPHAKSRLELVTSQLRAVTGPGPEEAFPAQIPEPVPRDPGALQSFEHATHMCLAALCDGWEVEECVQMWAQVQHGTFSKSGRTFIPGPRTPQSTGRDWPHTEVRTISRALGEAPVSIYAGIIRADHRHHVDLQAPHPGRHPGRYVPSDSERPPLVHRPAARRRK